MVQVPLDMLRIILSFVKHMVQTMAITEERTTLLKYEEEI